MSLARAVATNTAVQLAGRAVTTACSLAIIGILTRSLGVAGYGSYTTAVGYGAVLAVLADAGFFWILLRELSAEGADGSRIASNILTLRSVLALVVFGAGAAAAWLIPQYPLAVRQGIAVASLAGWISTVTATLTGVFQVRHRMERAVLADVLGRAVVLGGISWLAGHGGSLAGMLWAYVAGNAAGGAASLWLSRPYVRLAPRFDRAYWRRIVRAALPMGVALVLGVLYFRVDAVLLSVLRGSTDVGIYGPPYKIIEALLALPTMFLGNVFPSLARLLGGNRAEAGRISTRALTALVALAVPVVTGGIILAAPMLRFVAGAAYAGASTVALGSVPVTGTLALQVLLVALGLAFVATLFSYLLVAAGRQRLLVVPNAGFLVLNVVSNLILLPRLSYLGAALATVLTELAVVSWLGSLVRREVGVRPRVLAGWQIVGAGAGMAAAVAPLRHGPLALAIGVGAAVYLGLLAALGAVRSFAKE